MYKAVNKNIQPEAQALLDYLCSLRGKGILTGQHTQTRAQEELHYIHEVTGKYPALCGFELLGYSPNINRADSSEECLTEADEAAGTLKNALEWAECGGIITMTWHWFSPLGGRDKSFFSRNTDFSPSKALIDGTAENRAFFSDMDYMAGILTQFCERHIPILWRPFHEAEGNWFWWSIDGAEVVKQLYITMYKRYTGHFHLDNLIWVFNSPSAATYPGDRYVDILTRDLYPPAHEHISLKKEMAELRAITQSKLLAIGEIGTLPDLTAAVAEAPDCCYYMNWSKEFTYEEYTSREVLSEMYNSAAAVTLDKLQIKV